ncbi:hypothetical protein [Streptomyces sp. CC228A]|uniref:hypothetical protein n=1 Tax=Streptomyces sp. CC228A TaxID=2898186 RepID=UPI001F213420|nr:hypothetical protein [Streptomyces sp. CC228A]
MPGAAFAASADDGGRDCDGGSPAGEGGLRPAAPPRGSSAGELLPALYEARAAAAAGCGAAVVTAITPERAPPLLAPPSPMDLSILRV